MELYGYLLRILFYDAALLVKTLLLFGVVQWPWRYTEQAYIYSVRRECLRREITQVEGIKKHALYGVLWRVGKVVVRGRG